MFLFGSVGLCNSLVTHPPHNNLFYSRLGMENYEIKAGTCGSWTEWGYWVIDIICNTVCIWYYFSIMWLSTVVLLLSTRTSRLSNNGTCQLNIYWAVDTVVNTSCICPRSIFAKSLWEGTIIVLTWKNWGSYFLDSLSGLAAITKRRSSRNSFKGSSLLTALTLSPSVLLPTDALWKL